MKPQVYLTDYGFKNIDIERSIVEQAGGELHSAQCKTPQEVIDFARDADVILAQWAPLNAEVIKHLTKCRGIVRYGIGVDNIDLHAARTAKIAVANVPDYCIDEVADHTLALALGLVRQLPETDRRLRSGEWKITPPKEMPALRDMTFATAGFGRIAQAVLRRAKTFGCRLAAFDPFVEDQVFTKAGVTRLEEDSLFKEADILSFHLPLTPATRHFANAHRLAQMKAHSIIINTARGGVIDTFALASALDIGRPAFAGLDVYETEPISADHPLLQNPAAILTSHTAWYSSNSVLELQRLAAEEVARCVRGEAFKNPI